MDDINAARLPERRIFTVSELTETMAVLLQQAFPDIWVSGEISGLKRPSSGHAYFTLKDKDAQLRCACFRGSLMKLRFAPQDGMAVLARGRIDVYAPRGDYQLIVEALEPQGSGALQLAFEQLKKRLAEEGLFDAARKRPLPALPRRIGIVTSPAGAAIHDIIQVLSRRFPGVHVRLYPASVQGAGSIEAVVAGIEHFSQAGWAEVIIVGRGGGSLEDLWTFNEERVARAIAACSIPVISAVGHETDFTIADFVADHRAPTPSAAAEIVLPSRQQVEDRLTNAVKSMNQSLRYRLTALSNLLHERGVERATSILRRTLGMAGQKNDDFRYRLHRASLSLLGKWRKTQEGLQTRLLGQDPRIILAESRHKEERLCSCLGQAMRLLMLKTKARQEALRGQLDQLSPLKVLERGYAIVQDEGGKAVRSAAEAQAGSEIGVRLWQGSLLARVTRSIPPGSSELPS